MLVYGDARRRRRTADLLAAVAQGGEAAFFEAAGMTQGLLDAEFATNGFDDLTPTHEAAAHLLQALARGASADAAVHRLRALTLPESVTVTVPEGYAFYAVYPEAYRFVARGVRWSAPPLVIGLRSIGTGLAAVVAAETGGQMLTLRPTGDPFARRVRVSSRLRDRLASHSGPFAIVDEGPGLSGSSFGAVGDLLEDLGVTIDRLVFMPSHAGPPGREASARHLERWRRARTAPATLDGLLAARPIASWFEDITGPIARAESLGGGAWRQVLAKPGPASPQFERVKYRLRSPAGAAWLARFAGLGAIGEAKLAIANRLHAGGFGPEPLALRDGFLLTRWENGEAPSSKSPTFLDMLARYLAFRATAFPAQDDEGADPTDLVAMIARNAGLQVHAPPRIGPSCHVDGRLHPWEWLERPDGQVIKLDAIDHACGHDLIGCQPIAWDVAGASVELDLSPAQTAEVAAALERRGGHPIGSDELAFFQIAYAAFQYGLWTLGARDAEAERQRGRYASFLTAHGAKALPDA